MNDLPARSALDAARTPPEQVLAIGVTGHRAARLDPAALPALTAAIAATLAQIERAAQAATADVRVVSALADGADSLVAEAALARGWPLWSVLPFARKAYAADFTTPATRATFERLLAAAARLCEPADGIAAPFAYVRAGQIMVAQCDLLIAVWDGQAAQGRGGTAEIVTRAIAGGMPVIRIDPAARAAPLVLIPDGTSAALAPLDRLPDLIGAALRASANRVERPDCPAVDDEPGFVALQRQTAALGALLARGLS